MAKVLIATDGSETALAAARQGVQILGTEHDYEVICVASGPVVLPVGEPLLPGAGAPLDAEHMLRADERARSDAAAQVAATVAAMGIAARPTVLQGDPAEEICRHAGVSGADLVVIGSHGSGLLKRVLVGSVSNHVLHHAVPGPAGEAAPEGAIRYLRNVRADVAGATLDVTIWL